MFRRLLDDVRIIRIIDTQLKIINPGEALLNTRNTAFDELIPN